MPGGVRDEVAWVVGRGRGAVSGAWRVVAWVMGSGWWVVRSGLIRLIRFLSGRALMVAFDGQE